MGISRPVPSGAGFAFDMSARALDEQRRRIEALDAKAGILVAADGVLGGLLFGAGSVIRNAPRGVAISASVALIASLVLALLAFANRRYEEAPKPEAVIRLMAADEAWLRWRFLGNLTKALDTNRTKLKWKAAFLTSALAGPHCDGRARGRILCVPADDRGTLMATQREEAPAEEEIAPSRVPRPVDGGIDYVESLGRFVDNLMGDARAIRAAERHLAPLTLRAHEMPDDPEPSEPPPPVPDATEVITRGDSPEGGAR